MRAAMRAMLENMPDPSDLHVERHEGRCWVMVGPAVLAEYAEADTVMRNFAVTSVRRAGFEGKRVAEVFGLSAAYVSTLHAAALREGSAALVKNPGRGRPAVLGGEDLDRAREWRAAGVSDREIGRRLGTAGTTISRQLGPRQEEPGEPVRQPAAGCEPLFSEDEEPAPVSPSPFTSSSSLLLLLPVTGTRSGAGRMARRSRRPATRCPAGRVAGGWCRPRAAGSPGAGCGRGTRAQCCCIRSPPGRVPGRSWPRRPGGTVTGRGCWRR